MWYDILKSAKRTPGSGSPQLVCCLQNAHVQSQHLMAGQIIMVYQVGYGKVWRASNTLYIPCAKLDIQTLLWDSPYSTFNNLDPITAQFSLLLGIWAWHHLSQAGWSKCECEGNDLFHLPRDCRLFHLPWEWGYFICCENGAVSSAMRMSAISSAMRMWTVQG